MAKDKHKKEKKEKKKKRSHSDSDHGMYLGTLKSCFTMYGFGNFYILHD